MEYPGLRTTPTQNARTDYELYLLRFSFNSTVQSIKAFEDFHRIARRLFVFCPVIAIVLPRPERFHSFRVVFKLRNQRLIVVSSFVVAFRVSDLFEWIVPPNVQPCVQQPGRFRRFRQSRTPNP
jgi:hypothetical protein